MKCFVRLVGVAVAVGLVFVVERPVRAQVCGTCTTWVTIPAMPTVGPGGTIPILSSVENVNDTGTDFTIAAEIQRPDGSTIQLNDNTPVCQNIPLGKNPVIPFRFTVPYSGFAPGTYTAHVVVRERVDGFDCGAMESQGKKCGDGTMTFTVGANPAFTGRIAYQVYSGYLNLKVNSTDGTLQLYTLPSSSPSDILGAQVQYAANPKFSPDGSSIVFAGIPLGVSAETDMGYNGSFLQVFLYNFADQSLTQLTSNGSGRNEDPNFSPDGRHIVYKHTPTDGSNPLGQIWLMNLDGSGQAQLITSTFEESAPAFSLNGNAITYFTGGKGDPGGSGAESIWTVPYPISALTPPTEIVDNMESFYSSYLDANTILFTQWVETNGPNTGIFTYTISSQSSQPLLTNMTGITTNGVASDADAFPVNMTGTTTLVGFSSTRPQSNSNTSNLDTNGKGSILYLGDTGTGAVYYLPNLDPNLTSPPVSLSALGGTYTPYAHSRKLAVSVPLATTVLPAGTSVAVQAKAWSDGGPWTGTVPMVTLTAPDGTQAFATLEDSGTTGTVGNVSYEIYTGMVTLPSATGTYTISANAASADNGGSHAIAASSFTVPVEMAQTLAGFPSQQTIGESQSLTLPANTSAPLSVTYTVTSGPGKLTGSDTLTFTGTGTVIVTATQMGNGTYAPFATTDTITVVTGVPTAPRWMLALLLPILGFAAFRVRRTQRTGI